MEKINFTLDAFEGPLDLLLHLIAKHKIDIYDIPIAKLLDQYMEYIDPAGVAGENMDRLSEFLVMAAALMEIKSKTLLPPPPSGCGAEPDEDPREALINRLTEYKLFREAVSRLKDRRVLAALYVTKGPEDILTDMKNRQPPIELDFMLGGLTPEALHKMFRDALSRKELKTDSARARFGTVYKDTFTIEDKIERVMQALASAQKLRFSELFPENAKREEVIVTFLAVLELARLRKIAVWQDRVFESIIVTRGPSQ